MRTIFVFAFCFSLIGFAGPKGMLLIGAKVNGKSVQLIYDTGAEKSVLFTRTAKRLGLKWVDPATNVKAPVGKVILGETEECELSIKGKIIPLKFHTDQVPDAEVPGIDGVLSWLDFPGDLVQVDADADRVVSLSKLPKDIDAWKKLAPQKDLPVVAFKLANAPKEAKPILIDTGNSSVGVELSVRYWGDFHKKHKGKPYTIGRSRNPAVGVYVHEQYWASEVNVGELSLANVPVAKSPYAEEYHFGATLGLFALTRLQLIIDRKNSVIYVTPNPNPKSKFEYNRFGITFFREPGRTVLLARVAKHGPAYAAGIRDNDIMHKIDGLDITDWEAKIKVEDRKRFWEGPVGQKIKLTMLRNYKEYQATVVSKDYFPMGSKSKKE